MTKEELKKAENLSNQIEFIECYLRSSKDADAYFFEIAKGDTKNKIDDFLKKEFLEKYKKELDEM